MGKTYRHRDRFDDDAVWVDVTEIFVSDSTVDKLIARDGAQIEKLRADFENGRHVVRVVLRPRFGGGYNIEDGRHRVIAAKLAGVAAIEAIVVGS